MFDIAIIGSGPGGYTAAIKAAQLGAKTLIIEKGHTGGTCLNRGCIPTKTLLNSADKINDLKKLQKLGISTGEISFDFSKASKRKDITILKLRKGIENLISKNQITLIKASATIKEDFSLLADEEKIDCKNLIIASGTEPQNLPNIKRDGEFILNSDDILNLPELPKSILIIGSGAIGIEWSRIFNAMGVDVTIIEVAPNLLPAADLSVSEFAEKNFKSQKIKFYTSTTIEKITDKTVFLSNGETLTPDLIFLAAGRKPNLDFIKADIKTEKGFISVNTNFQTNKNNIYAIGDVTGKLQLAHVASHQGVSVVEHILENKPVDINYNIVPSIIYGKPEIAAIGLREQDLSGEYQKSYFPMSVLGKSAADDEPDGFIKVLAQNNIIKGAHIVSKEASALIHNFSLPIKNEIPVDDLEHLIFAHPTYAEGIHEAILGLNNKAIHL